ncbi:PH domain-containing protein [Halobiforma nitratireducens]|uniref:Membrane-flanked domain-containing protein n=1 Tax=Halobiforma nitratireducens JCM 10879 TaxID=1227454 RepID=M0LSX1_9EURY|nr:PH domain-containing protein [Halobiforma nitratireducens]EMA36657.1 membrane-flanked domain-containing protein [Halobiforma nitratireducens JCM 10879]
MNRLHPLSAVTYAIQYGFLWLWIPVFLVVVLAGVFDPVSGAWVPVAAPFGFLFGIGYGVAYYYRFGYEVTTDTVDVSSGVVARRSREIPYRRIQNVDIRQSVFQRLFGLATVSVETAGGGDTEASLYFVSEGEANRLQSEIRRRTAEAKGQQRDRKRARRDEAKREGESEDEPASRDLIGPEPPEEFDRPAGPTDGEVPPRNAADDTTRVRDATGDVGADARTDRVGPEPADRTEGFGPVTDRDRREDPTAHPQKERLFDLEAKELLLYSFTSFRPAAVAAVLFIFFFATEAVVDLFVTIAQPFGGPTDLETGDTASYGILTIISGVISILVTYALSVAYTFATYYDFQLGRVGDDFVYERGLLQRYSGSIPSEKVQAVTVTDNPLQRLIEYGGLWVETAGYGPESNGGSQSAVPLAQHPRVYRFTENLTGVETPKFEGPPPIARRRYLVRYSLLAAVFVAIAFGVSTVTAFENWYVAAAAFLAVPPAAHLRYVHIGYYVGDDHIVIRGGFWRRRTTVVPYYRLQTVSVRRSIFQRRLGIASLVVDTASSRSFFWSSTTVYDIDLEDAREARDTSRDRLQTALRERAADDDLGLEVDFT